MAVVGEQAAPPKKALPPERERADPFSELVLKAQDDLSQGVERAGLTRDPYRYLMGALSHSLGVFPAFIERLDDAIEQARQPIDPAAVERLEQAAINGADQRAAALARAHNLRTLLVYGGVSLILAVGSGGGGYLWGRASATAVINDADQRVAAAFRDGGGAAAGWANLMELNDLPSALAMCVGSRSYTDAAGRKVCLLPFYVDPLRRAAPGEPKR